MVNKREIQKRKKLLKVRDNIIKKMVEEERRIDLAQVKKSLKEVYIVYKKGVNALWKQCKKKYKLTDTKFYEELETESKTADEWENAVEDLQSKILKDKKYENIDIEHDEGHIETSYFKDWVWVKFDGKEYRYEATWEVERAIELAYKSLKEG